MEKQRPKAQYESPVIQEHGDVKEITLQGGTLPNSDIPHGQPGTAWS